MHIKFVFILSSLFFDPGQGFGLYSSLCPVRPIQKTAYSLRRPSAVGEQDKNHQQWLHLLPWMTREVISYGVGQPSSPADNLRNIQVK